MPRASRPRRRRRAARVRHERRHDARRALRRRAPARRRARGRVLDACARGGTSIYATGSSPGFITDALPFALLSMQRRVESIEIDEFAEPVAARLAAPALRADGVRHGRSSRTTRGRAQYLLGEFGPALGALAEAAGRPVDEWTCDGRGRGRAADDRRSRPASSRPARSPRSGRRSSGTTATAPRSCGSPRTGTAPTDVDPAWDLRPTGWRVRVRGDAPIDVDLAFPVPLDDLGSFTPGFTANRPVNAIPYVCAGRAGNPLDDRPAADRAGRPGPLGRLPVGRTGRYCQLNRLGTTEERPGCRTTTGATAPKTRKVPSTSTSPTRRSTTARSPGSC